MISSKVLSYVVKQLNSDLAYSSEHGLDGVPAGRVLLTLQVLLTAYLSTLSEYSSVEAKVFEELITLFDQEY